MINRIMLALFVEQPMEAVLLPGILDGLSGRLGLTPPGVVDQPTSAREGFSWRWAAALREAVLKTEGREPDPDQVTPHVVHPALHQDYELDFRRQRVDDIAPTLTSPMLAGIASHICLPGRPAVPKGPASPKTEEGLQGHGGVPVQPAAPRPLPIGGPMETEGENPLEVETIDLDVTILAELPEEAADVVILDDKELSFLVVTLRPFLLLKSKWLQVTSSHRRTQVHTHLLQRSGPQKKWRRARLLMMYLSQEGQRRKTSSPRDMRSLPPTMNGYRA